ncbi:MAG: sugar phosphate nucleotidyltransferase, partial [Gaiellaceae bacterium]
LVRFHREKGALVTIGLKSVPNPLEFGIVVTDDDGRIERFLEKPSWGQVFTDTINTGIYVLEPEVLRHVPADTPYDFSKELFPLLLEMGKPLYGYVADGYWQDIGNLDQYRQANFDALDERVRLNVPGIRLRGNVWVGEGVDLDNLGAVQGPAFVGNYCRIASTATVGPYSVLMPSVTLGEHARTTRSVVDASTAVGHSALVEGAIVGRACDLRPHARLHEGVAVGDDCTIGEESVVMPGVRIYPFKEVESGALVDRNLIWESRLSSRLIGLDGITGRINVDLTPEIALRLGIALGTTLERGERIVSSRAASASCRLIRRALLAGVNSTGVHVADLQVLPAAVNRHLLKHEGFGAGVHVQPSAGDPEIVEIRLFEPPGTPATPELVKEIEKHYSRQEFRRAAWNEVGEITFPARSPETYAQDLLAALDAQPIRERGFRIVVDYAFSPAALVLPQILGALDVEAVSSRAYVSERRHETEAASLADSLERTKRLVQALGADLGAALDPAAERIFLVDDRGREVPVEQELLLFLRLLASDGKRGRLAVPSTVTSLVEDLVGGADLEVLRTAHSLSALTRAAAGDGVIFAGSAGGGFVFPEFVPAYDGMASLCKLLELLAPAKRPLSEIVGELPASAVVHHAVRCPWARKGTVMRVVTERMKGRNVDVSDGVKVFDERGWAQVVPDPDEPLVHVYAEGTDSKAGAALETEFVGLVEEVVAWEDEAEEG